MNLINKNYTLVFNKSELGAGTRGSSLGVDSILIEASKRMKTFFLKTPSIKIDTKNELEYYKNGGILQYVLRNMI